MIWSCVNFVIFLWIALNAISFIFAAGDPEWYYFLPALIPVFVISVPNIIGDLLCLIGLHLNSLCLVLIWQVLFIVVLFILTAGFIISSVLSLFQAGFSSSFDAFIGGLLAWFVVGLYLWFFFFNRLIWTINYKNSLLKKASNIEHIRQ